MAANRDAGVDPRFDPVFQRGYDPAKHGGRRPHRAPRPSTDESPVTPIRESVVEATEVPAAAPAPELAAPPAEPEAELELRARNPFRLALLVASIAAIAGAAALLWNRLEDDPYLGVFASVDVGIQFRTQFIEASISPLLMGGLLGLALWLALGAMRWRPRAGGREDEDQDHG